MRKKSYMMLRLSEEDKKFLKDVAKKNDVSLSMYVLKAAKDKAMKDKK